MNSKVIKRKFKIFKSSLIFVIIIISVSSCYIPASFDAEIRINRDGMYHLIFDGYLVESNLFNKLVKDKISIEEENKRVNLLKRDLVRDSSTKFFGYFKMGHFRIRWENEGNILRTKTLTFLRRNENILSISYNKIRSMVSVQGTQLSRTHAQRIVDMGLGLQGSLRVITNADVKSHNATSVKKAESGYKIYSWILKSPFDLSPSLTFYIK